MLNKKQIKMLQLLDDQIASCNNCECWVNQQYMPYWTPSSKYGIICKSTSYKDSILNVIEAQSNYKKEDFFIIGLCNCTISLWNTEKYYNECFDYVHKYLKIIKPKSTIILNKETIYYLLNDKKYNSGDILNSETYNTKIIISNFIQDILQCLKKVNL